MAGLALTCDIPPACEPQAMVGIVGSAGAIGALFDLLRTLPPAFPVPIVVGQHLARGYSNLDNILRWRTGRDVRWVEPGDAPMPGVVHVVRPGEAVQITSAGFEVLPLAPYAASWLSSPDLLLTSIAERYGARAVGIVLSGMLPAGISGLRAIRAAGGIVMAQSSGSSEHHDMPAAAIDFGKADIIMSPVSLARALNAMIPER